MDSNSLEYKVKDAETPFETFLRYSTQKDESASKLATILAKRLAINSSILDIGSGNGEYLNLVLSKIHTLGELQLTLIEPSEDLVKQLKTRFTAVNARISTSDLQNFESDEKYDVILMSHLFYHIPRQTWAEQIKKAHLLLKSGGMLIIVLREKDDAYEFKMAFKPVLFGSSFTALTLGDVLDVLPKEFTPRVERSVAEAVLKLPLVENLRDTIAIIEFFLGKDWNTIPEKVQKDVLDFIQAKNASFKQIDGIAAITGPIPALLP